MNKHLQPTGLVTIGYGHRACTLRSGEIDDLLDAIVKARGAKMALASMRGAINRAAMRGEQPECDNE